ncbi:uncharacterized protein LOC112189937 isoform X2 [Rosa chinensis]|uniref:uncharacterized protein LOC112189937 isoform X2 n=1 Tax=Rosa chinensis TaxID=74649 RepID=UPI001AD949C7|nr:uncharacterized protein LOC112189937 isoform X2 [Rosa chinensis]
MGKPCHSLISGAGGIQALMKSNERKLAEEDQSILMASECLTPSSGLVCYKTLHVKFKALTLKRLKLNLNNNRQMEMNQPLPHPPTLFLTKKESLTETEDSFSALTQTRKLTAAIGTELRKSNLLFYVLPD